ncbi:tctex1 domain-containing protein [Cyclospora cayetanensis]|nr:tctex1 domain-containing protein [Cyclospora cayetanensis]
MGRENNGLQQLLDKDSSSIMLPLSSRFPMKAAQDLMKSLLECRLKEETYSVNTASQLSKALAITLRDSLSELCKPRYRIAISVDLGEDCGQGIRVGCRCFWDKETDSMTNAVYRNASLFCVATLYAVYLY